jgi:hypothetical protein
MYSMSAKPVYNHWDAPDNQSPLLFARFHIYFVCMVVLTALLIHEILTGDHFSAVFIVFAAWSILLVAAIVHLQRPTSSTGWTTAASPDTSLEL